MTLQVITTGGIIRKNGPNRPYPLITRFDMNSNPQELTVGVMVGDKVFSRAGPTLWHEGSLEPQYRPVSKPAYEVINLGERPRYLRWFTYGPTLPNGNASFGSVGWTTTSNTSTSGHTIINNPVTYDPAATPTTHHDELAMFSPSRHGWLEDTIWRANGTPTHNVDFLATPRSWIRRILSIHGAAYNQDNFSDARAFAIAPSGRRSLVGVTAGGIGLGNSASPALGDMVTNGNTSSTAGSFFWAGTDSGGTGIRVRARNASGTINTNYGVVGWPTGRSLTGLGAILLAYMPSNYLVVLAVWQIGNNTIGWATRLNSDGTFSTWTEVWNEPVVADLAYVAFDQYPHDNSLRMAASSFAPTSTTWLFEADATTIGVAPPPPNMAPNVPVWVTLPHNVPVDIPLSMSWSFSDPDDGATQSAYEIRRDPVAAGATTYWRGTANSWTTTSGSGSKIFGAATSATVENAVPNSFAGQAHDFSVRTWDQGDLVSGWSTALRLTRQSSVPQANLTTPVTGSTFDSGTIQFNWTIDSGTQASYRIRVFQGVGTGGTVRNNTGQITDTATTASLFVPGEGVHTAELVVYTFDGVASLPETTNFTIDIPEPEVNSPPNAPIVTAGGDLPITSLTPVSWTFSDPDGDSQSAYEIRRTRNNVQSYWLGNIGQWSSSSGASTKHTGNGSSFAVTPAADYNGIGVVASYAVRTWDQDDEVGPYSDPITWTRVGVPIPAAWTFPTPNHDFDPGTYTFTWTPHAAQRSYRIQIYVGTSTSGTRIADTGVIVSQLSQRNVSVFGEGAHTAELTLFTSDNVASDPPATVTFTVAEGEPPPAPNVAPTAPTITSVGGNLGLDQDMIVEWQFNDPNPMDNQMAYEVRRLRNGNTRYWRGPANPGWLASQSSLTKQISNAMAATTENSVGTNRIGQVTELSVRTWDNNDVPGPFSESVTFTRVADALTATIIAPADGATLNSQTVNFQWTPQPGQASYRLRVYDGATTTGSVLVDTGQVTSTASSQSLSVAGSGTRTGRLEIYNGNGVASNSDTVTFTVVLAAAGSGSFRTATDYSPDLPNGRFNYFSDSPGNADFTHVDIHRRTVGTGDAIRVAKNQPIPDNWSTGQDWTDYTMAHGHDYEYQVIVYATGASPTVGEWTRISTL